MTDVGVGQGRVERKVRSGAGATVLLTMVLALLAGCAAPVRDDPAVAVATSLPTVVPSAASAAWKPFALPGKAGTRYEVRTLDHEAVVHAVADSSASMWRRQLRIEPGHWHRLAFSWQVPALIPGADLTQREGDDAPVRIVLAFDGEHARLSMRDRMMFELAETLTGEAPPYATLMYVWDPRAPVDSIIRAPRSDRVRSVVVESGPQRVGRWLRYERDIVADYRRAYGEDPGALIGVAVMTDSDNTRTRAEGYYGQLRLIGPRQDWRLL